ncbi:glycoside hydrolase superfamily [Penicillium citrinum]|uniref:Probable beta-glucosidase G n=1 Tax=Penicillium citrinum TaxID=5077 RepID=A0A9W9PGA9_PENCI|nr:glycoside hydrolase superfamily [Penicillium citrinum]KAJ5243207.1 glycoside hydrolase superfamily [Penicillium citrinum]
MSVFSLKAPALFLLFTSASAISSNWDRSLFSPEGSPEVPGPDASGLGWKQAFQHADEFISQLTIEEKVGLVSGTEGPCVGNIAPIDRLNFTGICIQNGPLALEQGTYSSVFPAGITIAATWDKDIAFKHGYNLGSEFRGKGSQVVLGPVAGPLGRSAFGGRNWEGFSPDPYLTGDLFTSTIEGIQHVGVQACAKHFIGNEQETQRQPSTNDDGTSIESVSSNIDDRTLHELYLWPFQQAVKAGVASVMCSYNRINQTYGCQNSQTLNGILKTELGFQGYVVSDWAATHSGAKAVNAGEDMDMPGTDQLSPVYWHQSLVEAVKNGSVSSSRLDDMCRRVMTPYFHLKQDKNFPAIDPSEKDLNALLFSSPEDYRYNYTFGSQANVDVRKNHGKAIREAGAAGVVLLKNNNGTLPLKSLRRIGVFGNDAGDLTNGMSYFTFNGIQNYEYGVLATGGGSGSGLFTYIVSPLEAIKQKADFKKNLVQYVLNNSAIIEPDSPYLAALQPSPPDVCLVFLKSWATESMDRESLHSDWNGDKVVESIAAMCPNTVVITHSNGVNVMPWADNPNVTAILAGHLPGQEAGNSIVDVLWGDVNPSGHLPYTIAHSEDSYSFAPITNSTALENTQDPKAWQSDFKEEVLIDYRHFDYYNRSVAYEFGYGLSYTTFSINKKIGVHQKFTGLLPQIPPNATIIPGGNPHLWDNLYEISATVMNTGKVAGFAVPQLYLSIPRGSSNAHGFIAKRVLRGFEKVHLDPRESKDVVFRLTRRDISTWDTVKQQWVIPKGEIQAFVGLSSRDFHGSATFTPY